MISPHITTIIIMAKQKPKQDVRTLTELDCFIIENIVRDNLLTQEKTKTFNSVEISGIEIQSSNESLKTIEKCANRLLKKHKDFLLMKKENDVKIGVYEK